LLSGGHLPQALKVLVTIALTIYVLKQVRKPDRFAGRFFTWIMNLSHSALTDWGLSHVQIAKHFTILDVGCGGGRTIQKLAALAADGKVYGVDYASGSVTASRSKNAELIRAGRVEVQHASVSQLPFADDTFDLISAVETQYYWPDLPNDMREILRVLKPGGTLIVILEVYKRAGHNVMERQVMKVLKSADMDVDEQRELFEAAGYTDVQIFEESRKGWLCATGRKPS
jgi:ubiquinone/menaquinone biosynthesis C-methylase UbiE